MTNRRLLALLGGCLSWIALTLPLATRAASTCCFCREATGENDTREFTEDSKNFCIEVNSTADCGNLHTSDKNLRSVVCMKESVGSICKSIADKGRCAKIFDPTTYAESVGAIPSTKKIIKAIPFKLNVPIPGLIFAKDIEEQGGFLVIPYLAQYVSALYRYLLGITAVAAAVMIVYGGFLFIVGATATSAARGTEYITNAVVGLFLVFGVYAILGTINPKTRELQGVKVRVLDRIEAPRLQDYNDAAKALGKPGLTSTDESPKDLPTGTVSGEIASTGSPGNPSKGCAAGPATVIRFPFVPAGPAGATWRPDKSHILVPGKAINCPGNYPVLLWFHGNGGWGETYKQMDAILDGKINNGKAEPLIVVFPASGEKSDKMFPSATLEQIRDEALKTLRANPKTQGIQFSSVSVGGHSGFGCNKLWSTVNTISPYAILNADTCFGLQEESHNPQKMVIIVGSMAKLSSVVVYPKLVSSFKLKQMEPCPKLPFELAKDAKLITQNGAIMNCMKQPDKEWYLFYAIDEKQPEFVNHLAAPAKALRFALEHFFVQK